MKVLLKRNYLENNAVVQKTNKSDEEMKFVGCSTCFCVLFAALDYSHLCQYLASAVACLLLHLLGKHN